MNINFLKHIRLRIREMRDMNCNFYEAKTPPKELRLSMTLIEYPEFPGYSALCFYEGDRCYIYPMAEKETLQYKAKIKECEKVWYPHFDQCSGDIYKKDEDG